MRSFRRTSVCLAAFAVLMALGACTTPPSDKKVATGVRTDCPIGTHICRHDGSVGPGESVSAEALRNQGTTTMGGMEPGQMMKNGGGS